MPSIAAGLTFLAFLPSLAAGYVYDDLLLVSENPFAKSLRFLMRGFRTHLWDVYAFGPRGIGLRYYRPLVSASYVLNWWAAGGAPWAFHLVNLLLHVAATFLATRIAARWTGSATLGLVCGLMFGLHPSRTESVIWVSGRTDVMMALFTLLAVECAHRAAHASRRRGIALAIGAIAATVASILCKEAGAATAILVLADFLLEEPGSPERKRVARQLVVLAVLGAAYLGFRAAFYPVRRGAPFEATIRYGFFTVWAYVERVVFPWPQTFFYSPVVEVGGVPHYPPVTLALGALVTLGAVLLLFRAFKRDRVAFVVLATAFGLLFPLLNFSHTGIYVTTSDHFLYLPLFAFAVGLLRLYRDASLRFFESRAARLLFVGVFAVYLAVDGVRVLDYRDDDTFWQHEIDLNPTNPVALQNMASILARRGQVDAAHALMERVVAPTATRQFLLAGDSSMRAESRARLLGLEAALIADGDVISLYRIFRELNSLVGIMFSDEERATAQDDGTAVPPGRERVVQKFPKSGRLNSVAADAALLGTRVGEFARAKALASAVPDEVLWRVSNPANFILTLARVGDFRRARLLLEEAKSPPVGIPSTVTPDVVADLDGRLGRAEMLMSRDRQGATDSVRMNVALAFAELGAFVGGLRVLRPAFDRPGHDRRIDPFYVQLLVSARLDREALSTASALLGPAEGRAVVERLTAQLSPRLKALKPPPEPSPWWRP